MSRNHENRPPKLPVGPIARRLPDGSITRVIPLDRHLHAMPELPPRSPYGGDPDRASAWGHAEVDLAFWRIDWLCEPENAVPLIEGEVLGLAMAQAAIQTALAPLADAIRSRCPADRLLPVDGRRLTISEFLARYTDRNDLEAVRNGVRLFHALVERVELAEAKVDPWLAELAERRRLERGG